MVEDNENICIVSEILENAGDILEREPETGRILQVLKWKISELTKHSNDKRLVFLSQFLGGYVDDIWRNMAIELTYESKGIAEEIFRETVQETGKKLKLISNYLLEDKNLEYYEEFSELYVLYSNKIKDLEEKRSRVRIKYSIGKLQHPDVLTPKKRAVAQSLDKAGAVLKCEHTLRSGMPSDYFLNIDKILSKPEYLDDISDAYVTKINKIKDKISKLAFIEKEEGPTGSIILLHSILMKTQISSFIVDLKKKIQLGRIKGVEPKQGEAVAIISDTATISDTILDVAHILWKRGLEVPYAIVLFDRELGADKTLKEYGIELVSILTQSDLESAGMIRKYPRREITSRENTLIPPARWKIEKYKKDVGEKSYEQLRDLVLY